MSAVVLSTPAWAEPVASASNTPPPTIVAPPPASGAVTLPTPADRTSLRGSVVYVYSFLDVHRWQFGHKTLKLVNSDLVDELRASGIQAKVLDFASSPVASSFKFPRFYAPYELKVPVEQVVGRNAVDEQQVHASYRLIVFLKSFSMSGTGGASQRWMIEWTLVDVATNQTVWSHATEGDRFLWYYDAGAEKCARGIVETFMAEFRKSGLI